MQIGLSIVLALLQLVAGAQAPDPETAAWDAATALKKKAAMSEAAVAFEAIEKANPTGSRAQAALVEAGVCWFSVGRDAQVLHRDTPQSLEGFARAHTLLGRVLAEHPTDVAASRAAYMQGSTHMFAGELEQAEAAYASVLDKYAVDPAYVAKALERRAFVRRHLLRPADAIADYKLWLTKFTTPPETVESVKKELSIAELLGKAPKPLKAEAWFGGEPVKIEEPSGDVIGLFFYATWCDKCAKEQPFVRELVKRYSAEGLHIIGVTDHSKGQTADTVKKYATDQGLPFPSLIQDGNVSIAFRVDTLPRLALIDREGVIRWIDNPANLADSTLERLLHGDEKPTPQK
jgi:thiol-disulfide isomerase/thioredoxin